MQEIFEGVEKLSLNKNPPTVTCMMCKGTELIKTRPTQSYFIMHANILPQERNKKRLRKILPKH